MQKRDAIALASSQRWDQQVPSRVCNRLSKHFFAESEFSDAQDMRRSEEVWELTPCCPTPNLSLQSAHGHICIDMVFTTIISPPTSTITAPVWHIFWGGTCKTALWSPQDMSYRGLCSGGGGAIVGFSGMHCSGGGASCTAPRPAAPRRSSAMLLQSELRSDKLRGQSAKPSHACIN